MSLQYGISNERVTSIDIIRGFALIGIFLVNVPSMFMPDFFYHFEYDGIDRFIRLFYDLFIQTKFYTIFAFLFGVSGFYFIKSIEKKGLSPEKFFSKRLIWMFLFGIIHITLLWGGDILHTYSFLGFSLLLFYKRKVKTMIIWASCLFFIYFTLETLNHFLLQDESTTQSVNQFFTAFKDVNGNVNFYNNYFEQVRERWNYFLRSMPYEIGIYTFEFIPIFLIGMATAKTGIFINPSKYIKGLKLIQFITLFLSIPFLVLMILEYINHKEASYYYVYITGKLLAAFYVCTFLRLLQKKSWERRLSFLAPLGKMAFSNYISHSIITLGFISLFINDTLSIPLWIQPLYVIVILYIQIIVSKIILSKWQYGPLEYGWRLLTYGTKQSTKQATISHEI